MSSATVHVPVLLNEVIHWSGLDGIPEGSPQSNARFVVDGTLGGGGHASHMIRRMRNGDTFLGIDRDEGALERTRKKLLAESSASSDVDSNAGTSNGCTLRFYAGSYRELPELIAEHQLPLADCILLDLGLSSDQLADRERGFSFRLGGPLDLRFNPNEGISAAEMLARIDEEDLANVIYQFGEERFSRRIARAIVERRRHTPIQTAEDLADIVHRSVPGKIHGRVDSATRTFQALRIAVNRELEHVQAAIDTLPGCLKPGGRLEVISFHSLEDRIIKHAMRESMLLNVLTKKPIVASEDEIHQNPRSRSAKLRVAERTTVGT